MDKIRLDIVGLSYSQTQTGAYALVLGERKGRRRLPIIIGGFEAQAIAVELEKMKPQRPLTHDLFKSFSDTFDIKITEVIIYNLVEGIFFAKLVCEHNGATEEIDARTSDAIALAVRFSCPIYTFEFILSTAGIILDEDVISEEKGKEASKKQSKPEKENIAEAPVDELEKLLQEAINAENYERASKLRDEIKRRKQS
jgi:uncharacterized protein